MARPITSLIWIRPRMLQRPNVVVPGFDRIALHTDERAHELKVPELGLLRPVHLEHLSKVVEPLFAQEVLDVGQSFVVLSHLVNAVAVVDGVVGHGSSPFFCLRFSVFGSLSSYLIPYDNIVLMVKSTVKKLCRLVQNFSPKTAPRTAL